MSNVQPGDIAVVVRVNQRKLAWLIGSFVGIDARCPCYDDITVWKLDKVVHGPRGMHFHCLPDRWLQRIGPKSDKASKKKIPQLEKESA